MEIKINFESEGLSKEQMLETIMQHVKESLDQRKEETKKDNEQKKMKSGVYYYMSKIKTTLLSAFVDIENWESDTKATRDYNDFYGKFKVLKQSLDSQMRYVIDTLNALKTWK